MADTEKEKKSLTPVGFEPTTFGIYHSCCTAEPQGQRGADQLCVVLLLKVKQERSNISGVGSIIVSCSCSLADICLLK